MNLVITMPEFDFSGVTAALERAFMGDVPGRVARGAALLDQRLPGWYGAVEVDRLNIADPQACILGQVYGSYYRGLHRLFGPDGVDDATDSLMHGFNGTLGQMSHLNRAWQEAIRDRMSEAAPVQDRVFQDA